MKSNAYLFKVWVALLSIAVLPVQAAEFDLNNASTDERMTYHRAIDAAIWAMPLMNFKFYRDALADNGVGPNDIGYNSKLQDWRFQTATPNNTTPYIHMYWNIENGPVVVELPPSEGGIGVFGTLLDAWQRPLDDVGAKGRDRGLGAKYLLVPPGYDGKLLPKALVYEQATNFGWAALRPILPGGATEENLAKATALTKKIKIYPLAQADNPPKMKFVDVYGKMLEMTPKMDGGIYGHIHEMINEEVVLERDKVMMGMLARMGIKKYEPYAPSTELQAIFDQAAPEALEYMIWAYHRSGINPWMWEGKKWSSLVPEPGSRETEWSYEFPSYYDYYARGALYYAIITSVKNYGTATFYLDLAETQEGEWLDGSKNYKLTMPADVPVENFWSITTYDLETASYLRNIEKSSIDSTMQEVTKNADGSVDIYFGPNPKEGKEGNWLKTVEGRRFFLLSRFYGPKPELFGDDFELNNIELIAD
ncbi:DUF1214 domain-containing protein [Coraliomargarita akajimensis]|uniref:DUF1254 domain-containing protein n=1 Tax=Coraliomargarita akajimensis (strain DSM 45221 / IAM 15411 / JCM 23193 / KCTC 12865 / 04OKA010-24) TaxID=583355 RepID=D5EJW9_CORAD|nr:DUF1254 domain-containing protein [Coraliomargarita akajimensis]ADE54718.1 protein of unknown function DUF1214 [Coraliomargarita akajimensis DSM 45221]